MTLLHQGASPAALRAVRIGVFALWIAKIATDRLSRLAALPFDGVGQVGVLGLVPPAVWRALQGAAALTAFQVLLILCLASSMVGRWKTPAALASCVLLTVHQGLVRGVGGYVNHAEMPLLYAAFILALSPVVDRWCRGSESRSDVPLILILAVLMLSYTLTAVSRLVLYAPVVFHPANITMWILGHAHETSNYSWQLGHHLLDAPGSMRGAVGIALSAGLVLITIVEVFAPCCLVSRRFRVLFLVTMIPFHLVVLVTMNILFWENLALFALLFDIDRLGRR